MRSLEVFMRSLEVCVCVHFYLTKVVVSHSEASNALDNLSVENNILVWRKRQRL